MPAKRDYPIKPVPFTEVRFTDRFWALRMETNRSVIIPHVFRKCEEEGKEQRIKASHSRGKGEYDPFMDRVGRLEKSNA